MENPVIVLSEKVQRKFRQSLITRVIDKSGPDHQPVITVEIELPNGQVYQASGVNQKIAKQRAAEMALSELF